MVPNVDRNMYQLWNKTDVSSSIGLFLLSVSCWTTVMAVSWGRETHRCSYWQKTNVGVSFQWTTLQSESSLTIVWLYLDGHVLGSFHFFCVFIAQSCIHVWSMTVLSALLLITVSRKYWPQFSVSATVSLTEPCERKHFESIYIYIYIYIYWRVTW
jgi:hypothetical protein